LTRPSPTSPRVLKASILIRERNDRINRIINIIFSAPQKVDREPEKKDEGNAREIEGEADIGLGRFVTTIIAPLNGTI